MVIVLSAVVIVYDFLRSKDNISSGFSSCLLA